MFAFATPKILYFTKGYNPTDAELKEAASLGVPVQWRNGMFAANETETCDGVAGSFTENYNKFPSAADAIAKYKGQFSDTAELVDSNSPVDVNNPTESEDGTVDAPASWKPNK